MIDELLEDVKVFFNKKDRNLLDGRIVQTKIHQRSAFFLRVSPQHEAALQKIVDLAQMEQDSLRGIEDNLKELQVELRSIV